MTASRLREAATLLREVAEGATAGPWKTWGMTLLADPVGNSNVDDGIPVVQGLWADGERPRTFNLTYIQTMQPPVALALADWLEDHSVEDDTYDSTLAALAVADAILGEPR